MGYLRVRPHGYLSEHAGLNTRVGVHAGQLLQPVPGGIGRYVDKLLGALGSADVDPIPFAAGPSPANYSDWVDIGFPRGRWRYALWQHVRRGSLRIGREIDLIHAPSLAIPPKGNLPLVVTVHDLVFLDHPDYLTPRGVAFHKRGLEIARDEAAAFVVPSMWVAKRLSACNVEADRIHVAHHGVDPIDSQADSQVASMGRPESFILFVGTIEPRKGIGDLIEALELVRKVAPHLHLVIAGPAGWGELPDLSASHIHCLGQVDDSTLDELYKQALGLVLPSKDEGFGLPVVEAMARGCPVIASDAACLPEIVGKGGTIVPLGDIEALSAAMLELTDPERRAALSQSGVARAACFSWHKSALAHASAYNFALRYR